MKKTLKTLLIILIMILVITGCNKKEKGKVQNTDPNIFTINEKTFKLDIDKNYEGLSYKISKDFREIKQRSYIQYDYFQEDNNNNNLLYFRIFYYENKDITYARKDLGIKDELKETTIKINNLEYQKIEEPRTDGGTIHFYFLKNDKNLYTINIVSRYDIKEFEEKVLNTILLNENQNTK